MKDTLDSINKACEIALKSKLEYDAFNLTGFAIHQSETAVMVTFHRKAKHGVLTFQALQHSLNLVIVHSFPNMSPVFFDCWDRDSMDVMRINQYDVVEYLNDFYGEFNKVS